MEELCRIKAAVVPTEILLVVDAMIGQDAVNAALAPERIVYISCNPRTQARDVRHLVKAGYEVRVVRPVDMFPHTDHVESIVMLEKRCENLSTTELRRGPRGGSRQASSESVRNGPVGCFAERGLSEGLGITPRSDPEEPQQ